MLLVQFFVWLGSLIAWGIAHAGEPGLAFPVLFQLAVLGLAGYLIVRPTVKLQLVYVVGTFVSGIVWAIYTGAHTDSSRTGSVVAGSFYLIGGLGVAVYALRRMKKADEDEAMLIPSDDVELHPAPPL